MPPLKIAIDARAVHMPGIGRYIRELVCHLSKVDTENRYVIYFSSKSQLEKIPLENPNFQSAVLPTPIFTVSEQGYLPLRLRRDRVDIFHATTSLDIPWITPCRLVVTFHDLLLKVLPEYLPSRVSSVYFNLINWRAVKSADAIITVSSFTASELTTLYPECRTKTTAIPSGVNMGFQPVQAKERLQAVKSKYGLKKRYFLYLGTYKKHKNLTTLVEAYGKLPGSIRSEFDLVLVGKPDPRYPEVPLLIQKLGLEDSTRQIPYVDEEDLPALYSGAGAFVYPSLYEGFGLPILEAMACGTPVIASRIPAFLEVAGDSAELVEPRNSAAMTESLQRVVSDRPWADDLREKGLQNARKFSWNQTARRVLDIYRTVSHGMY
jgi:alpha-1,3-rhamnosyl/mannosyltransferase